MIMIIIFKKGEHAVMRILPPLQTTKRKSQQKKKRQELLSLPRTKKSVECEDVEDTNCDCCAGTAPKIINQQARILADISL